MKIKSDVTHIEYEPEEVLFFQNLLQSAKYIENGAQIVDIDAQDGRLAIAFWRRDHDRLKVAWNNHEL